METATLQLFVEVLQQGSFAQVARIRNMAPSSVSRTIAKLEAELGIRLFQRSTRKLEPTEAGIIYFEEIFPLLDRLETAKQIATDVHYQPQGKLRVTVGSAFAQMQIVPLLPEFTAAYPKLFLDLILTDAYLDLIEERIDLAVRLGTLQDSSYIAKRLRKMSFYICASPQYLNKCKTPKIPQDLASHNCLLFPRANYSLNWLFRDRTQKITEIPIKGRYLLTDSLAIRQCAIAGMGLALLPDWLVNDDFDSGHLVRLFADYEVTATNYESSIWLLYPSRVYLPSKTKVLIDYLSAKLGRTHFTNAILVFLFSMASYTCIC